MGILPLTDRLRTLIGGHSQEVGSLDWKNHVLTSGGMDGKIINNDVRLRSHIVEPYGETFRRCGLKWSSSDQQLASGGNDNLLFIADRSMASSNAPKQWLYSLKDLTAAVKALGSRALFMAQVLVICTSCYNTLWWNKFK